MIALVDCYTRALPYGVFTIDASGEEVLLLFSFQEQREFCLHPAAPEKGWRPKEATAGDSVSSLLGLARGWRRRRSVHCWAPRGICHDGRPQGGGHGGRSDGHAAHGGCCSWGSSSSRATS